MRRSYRELEVTIPLQDVAEKLDDSDIIEIATNRGLTIAEQGDGDAAYARSVLMRAEAAARRTPALPREVKDLFWYVHGVAIA